MQFKLESPFIVALDQSESLTKFRGESDGIRSKPISKQWHNFKSATMNGLLEQHHIYFLVSRERARFSGLRAPIGQHFFYEPQNRTSPVEINFQNSSDQQTVMDGIFDLSHASDAETLLDAFKGDLSIDQLIYITGEPHDKQFTSAARFHFPNQDVCVRLSPDLWKFVKFPFTPILNLPKDRFAFDYRLEYIGTSERFVEERLDSHAPTRRVQSAIASQNPEREVFAILYQVNFEKESGETGFGSRSNKLELEAAEAILIQNFKPQYNTRSLNFKLTEKNNDPFDELLAEQMRNSGDYKIGKTQIVVTSPAAYENIVNLAWGRFFTEHHKLLYEVNTVNF